MLDKLGKTSRQQGTDPKDPLAVSLELDEKVCRVKGRRDTIDDFITKVFDQWLEWRETVSFLEEAYEKQSRTVEQYIKEIERLKATTPKPTID